MRRYTIVFSSIVLVAITFFVLQPETAKNLKNEIEIFTPQELHQQRMAEKREKISKGIFKADAPDEFAKMQYQIRTREGESGPAYEANYVIKELEKAQNRAAQFRIKGATYVSEWNSRGPANVPGRTRGLLVHPEDPENTWLAGSVGGGVWKTTDKGQSWTNLTPDLPNLATTTLAMSNANPKVIYAGTGEGFYSVNFINGSGIFKTTDGGNTWTQLASTANNSDFINVNRLIVDPANPDLLLACTSTGLYQSTPASAIMRSTDGGQSWSKVYTNNFPRIQQLIYTPGDFNIQYAALDRTGVLKSVDGGLTWQNASQGLNIKGRIELAIAPTKPNRLYASAEGRRFDSELYVSDDAAGNWHLVLQQDGATEENYLGGQGWYDNTIAVHPFDENKVYFGGVNLWLATLDGNGITTYYDVKASERYSANDYIAFQNFGGKYYDGRLDTGPATGDRWVNAEIRMGNGRSQKAHRFTVPETAGTNGDDGAGVPDSEYIYEDFVEVPFQVWDTENNRQLMVSFRDQERDGKFDLEKALENDITVAREYIFIHEVTYADLPDSRVAQKGGHVNERMYFMWPRLADDAYWDPANMPAADIKISISEMQVMMAITEDVSDAYGQFSGENSFPQTFEQVDQTGLHPDHHNLIMVTPNTIDNTFFILNANDGGVYYSKTSTDPGTLDGDWIFAGNGYGSSQFYGADKKRGYDEYIGGMQDNGTWRSPDNENASASTQYLRQIGGDGFEVLWHYEDTKKIIGGYQFNNFWKTIDGGKSWSIATNGLTDIDDKGIFISNLAGSHTNPDVIFTMGPSGVWKSGDFGDSWQLAPISTSWSANSNNPDIQVSLADDQVIWSGFGMTSSNRIHVSTDGGATFNPTSNYPQTMGRITGLATHPTDPATAYALFSFAKSPKILKTSDYGQTWEDISGFASTDISSRGFPDVAVHSLLVLPHDTNIIWAGTEIGLVESTDNGSTWNLVQGGVPATAIWNMKMVDDQVVMATHGRGIWTATIPETPRNIAPPEILASGVNFKGALVLKADLKEVYDSLQLQINQQLVNTFGKSDRSTVTITIDNLQEGAKEVQLVAYESGKSYPSALNDIYYFVPYAPVKYYENNFDEQLDEFAGLGYTITKPDGFSNYAIHSFRPYADQSQIIYTLRYPVIVDNTENKVTFNEIALVEPGDQNATFGSDQFKDYVVVEASDNGYEWQELGDGYDANAYSEWVDAFTDEQLISESLYKKRNYSLGNLFNAGDTVFVRFRLSSNETLSGWGWAIDDLLIQDPVLGLKAKSKQPDLLVTAYPNPFSLSTAIRYQLKLPGMVSYRIIDSQARVVSEKILGMQTIGGHEVDINTSTYKSGIYYFILYTEQGYKAVQLLKK